MFFPSKVLYTLSTSHSRCPNCRTPFLEIADSRKDTPKIICPKCASLDLVHLPVVGRDEELKLIGFTILGGIFGAALSLLALNLGGGEYRVFALFFLVNIVIGTPCMLIYSVVRLILPGQRKIVYGVGRDILAKTLIRGDWHPLWNKSTCSISELPSDTTFGGVWYRPYVSFWENDSSLLIAIWGISALESTPHVCDLLQIGKSGPDPSREVERLVSFLERHGYSQVQAKLGDYMAHTEATNHGPVLTEEERNRYRRGF